MPIAPTYPGVYIEEIPSGVRTITGVSTSVAAFIDFFQRGFLNRAIQIFSMADFEREFGGLEARSEASYAIQQFFRNGGTEAWVVRTASGSPAAANVQIQTAPGGSTALTITAGAFHPSRTNPGTWGNDLRVRLDYPAPTSNGRFNLTIMLVRERNGDRTVLQSETFLNLSMDASDARFVETVINDEMSGSRLVHVTAAGSDPPCQNGTVSGALVDPLGITALQPRVNVAIGSGAAATATLARAPATIEEARVLLEAAIRAARPESRSFSQASVTVVDNRLRVLAGPTSVSDQIIFSNAGPDLTFQTLGLDTGQNVQGLQSDNLSAAFPLPAGQVQITIGGSGPVTLTLAAMNDLAAARDELEARIRAGAADAAVLPGETDAFALARVSTRSSAGDDRLIVLAGLPGRDVSFAAVGADTTAADLGLVTPPATTLSAFVSGNLAVVPTIAAGAAVNVTIGGNGPHPATLGAAADLTAIAAELQAAMRAADAAATFTSTVVQAYTGPGENRLLVFPGTSTDTVVFAAAPLDATTVGELHLTPATGAQENVQLYCLGATTPPIGAQGPCNVGNDGDLPDAAALIGNRVDKTGMYALEDVDLFNLLCIPRAASLPTGQEAAVMSAAISYCEEKRAFFIMDTPPNIDTVAEIRTWLNNNATLRHKNAALYFPRVQIPDPLNGFRLRTVGASGTIAGLYARTDSNRGVWKAPAGTEANLRNVQKLDYALTDPENGALNPLAINCLRTFPIYGSVCWGARTLDGSDQQASEWKYVPVRRLALFLEESLYRGTKWVVFEPNDEPLWSQIRLNVGAFMHNLFKQGAFQGNTPRDAYFVKCDKETTTQNDRNLGIVNILVGFAPLKPAEFVIIKIQQIAGQIQT